MGEAALQLDEGRADAGKDGDLGGGVAGRVAAEGGIADGGKREGTRGSLGRSGVGRIAAGLEHGMAHCAVEEPGVEVRQIEVLGEPACERALARGGRAVHRDDHGAAILAPRPFMRATKPGKLVSIMAPSSTVTGALAPSPRMRKAMAIR